MDRNKMLQDMRTPCPDLQGVEAFAPFSCRGYEYSRVINVMSEQFKVVREAVKAGYDLPLYAPSPARPGLAIWDTATGLPACIWRTVYDRPREAKPVRSTNKFFESIIHELIRCGPIDKHRWRRPKGEFILDLPSYNQEITGWDLLLAAEVMAQHETLDVPHGPMLCERIRLWLARLHVGMLFDLPVFNGDWDCYAAGEMFPESGILLTTATDAYRPTCCVPMTGPGCPVPDKTVVVVCVGMGYGKLPAGFLKATGTHTAATRWACSPITSVIAGWLPVDGVTHMPIAQSNESYVLHFNDLEGSDTLRGVLSKAGPGMKVMELLNSPLYAKLYANSHPHPVPESLLILNNVNAGFVKPPGKCPEPLNPRSKEHRPWEDYLTSLAVIRDLITGASDAHERGRRISGGWQGLARLKPESRKSKWNKLVKLLDKKLNYERKRAKKQKEGFLSEARVYAQKVETVEKEITDALEVEKEVS